MKKYLIMNISVPAKTKKGIDIFISIPFKDLNLPVITLYNKYNSKDYNLFSFPIEPNVSLELSSWKKINLTNSSFFYQEI